MEKFTLKFWKDGYRTHWEKKQIKFKIRKIRQKVTDPEKASNPHKIKGTALEYDWGNYVEYYQYKPRKGDLKAWKEIRDAVPALYTIQKWEGFLKRQDFYID